MLHHSQSLNLLSPSKKIRKPKKPSPPQTPTKSPQTQRNPANAALDPIKSPFFSNFLYYPSSVKAKILRINRKPAASDLDALVRELGFSRNFINIESLRVLVKEQEKTISTLGHQKFPSETRLSQSMALPAPPLRKPELKVETQLKAEAQLKAEVQQPPKQAPSPVRSESEDTVKEFVKERKNSFYESSFSTTPSKKNSPLFNERKNLLLSSQIENILSDNYELFVKKFDEESLNLGSLEEEDHGVSFDGMWEDKDRFAENETGNLFRGLEVDRSFFSHERENQAFF